MKFILKNKCINIFLAGLLTACQANFSYLPPSPIREISPQERLIVELIRSTTSETETTDSLWNMAIERHFIPYAFDDSVYFFFKGAAESVAWNGDFNAWGQERSFSNHGNHLGNGIWLLKSALPADARVDYKVVVDGEWQKDPANSKYQYSGIGGETPNSTLLMPNFRPDSISKIKVDKAGTIIENNLIKSRALGYLVKYKIYLPITYDSIKAHPLLILTDGHEFSDPRLGNFLHISDVLTEKGLIDAPVVVMIDPRNPEKPDQNRRMQELALNPAYADFIVTELLPLLKSRFLISENKKDIAIGGVSLGGLNAAYLGARYPELVGKLAIMSPAFWYKPEIFDLWKEAGNEFEIYLSSGSIHDVEDETTKFADIIDAQEVKYKLDLIPQGHSWGNWEYLTDDMLIYLFGL